MTLKEIRLQKGLKAYKVAEFLEISRRQLLRIENGEVKKYDSYKNKLLNIYDLTDKDFLNAWEETKCKMLLTKKKNI